MTQNERRMAENPRNFNGIIMLCVLSMGQVPGGRETVDAIRNGTVNLYINDKPVANITDFADCGVLRSDDGHR